MVVSLPLSRGLSTQFFVRVFNIHAEPTSTISSFWLLLVGLVASCILRRRAGADKEWRAFDVLARVLQTYAFSESCPRQFPLSQVELSRGESGVRPWHSLRALVLATPAKLALIPKYQITSRGSVFYSSASQPLIQPYNTNTYNSIVSTSYRKIYSSYR